MKISSKIEEQEDTFNILDNSTESVVPRKSNSFIVKSPNHISQLIGSELSGTFQNFQRAASEVVE